MQRLRGRQPGTCVNLARIVSDYLVVGRSSMRRRSLLQLLSGAALLKGRSGHTVMSSANSSADTESENQHVDESSRMLVVRILVV